MNHAILVIDDQWRERRSGYTRLECALQETAPELLVSFDYVEDHKTLPLMTRRKHYAGAIVDAVLEEKWPRFTIGDAVRDLSPDVPFALLSARWDETNAEQIELALRQRQWRTFLHWRDIDPEGNGQIDFAVRSFVRMIAESRHLDLSMRLAADESIRIVHVSDIQTGGSDDVPLRLEARRTADRILTHWGDKPPTFVAFTGDVTEHGMPQQYQRAQEWIVDFCERLRIDGLPSRRLLYVPGNHDANLCLAAAARIAVAPHPGGSDLALKLDDAVRHRELLDYAFAPFRAFLSTICECPLLPAATSQDQSLAWVEARYRHLGVIFYGINTAQPITGFGVPRRSVDENALSLINDELGRVVSDLIDLPLIIGLGHHSPISGSDDCSVSNPSDFEKFFSGKLRTALFLHGHVHSHKFEYSSDGNRRLVRSCATTLTKSAGARPPDSLRGLNLLELTRQDHNVKGLIGTALTWLGDNIVHAPHDKHWVRYSDNMFREP